MVNVVAAFTAMGLLLVNFNSDPELRVALIALVGSELLGLAMAMFTWGVVLSTEPPTPESELYARLHADVGFNSVLLQLSYMVKIHRRCL